MIVRKANVYRLQPTPSQAERLGSWVGAVRYVYNVALEQRRDWYRPGRKFNFYTQCKELTELRADVDWINDVPCAALQQALKDLEQSYSNWWAGRAKAPTPRKRGLNDSFRLTVLSGENPFRRLSRHHGQVKLPKVGWVSIRWNDEIEGQVKNLTISRRNGVWSVAAQFEYEIPDPAPSSLPEVGIDRGVAVFAALSDGTMIEAPNPLKAAMKSLRRAQRKLSRKKKGSANRKKQVARVAKLHARVSSARKIFLHKVSTAIAKSHGKVVLEKLEVRNMTRSAAGTVDEPGRNVKQKSGLNRAILDQGWGMFKMFLAYKLAERGGTLVEVPAAYTSQTCSVCGVIDANSRVSQSHFVCTACGHEANADTNAAINILRRGVTPSLPVEGHRAKRPKEAGTKRGRSASC